MVACRFSSIGAPTISPPASAFPIRSSSGKRGQPCRAWRGWAGRLTSSKGEMEGDSGTAQACPSHASSHPTVASGRLSNDQSASYGCRASKPRHGGENTDKKLRIYAPPQELQKCQSSDSIGAGLEGSSGRRSPLGRKSTELGHSGEEGTMVRHDAGPEPKVCKLTSHADKSPMQSCGRLDALTVYCSRQSFLQLVKDYLQVEHVGSHWHLPPQRLSRKIITN